MHSQLKHNNKGIALNKLIRKHRTLNMSTKTVLEIINKVYLYYTFNNILT